MFKRTIQNSAILLLFLMPLKNIWTSLPFRYLDVDHALIHRELSLAMLQTHHILNFILGLLMLLLTFNLYKRIRMAWYLEVVAIVGTMVAQMFHLHRFTMAFMLLDLYILVVLLLSFKDFSRRSDKGSLRAGISYFIIALGIIFMNTATGLFMLKEKVHGIASFYDAVLNTLKLFILMDTSQFAYKSLAGKLYLDTSLILYWAAVFIGLMALMKPLIYKPVMSQYNKTKARRIINAHGQNPLSYLALEDDKQYYFSKRGGGAKMRASINHATKASIVVEEIDPKKAECEKEVRAMKAISREWLAEKNAPELSFTIGRDNFNAPMDRRYFVAKDSEGVVQAYVVYNPYLSGKAYMAEVTRRRTSAPRGVMEKINYEAFMKMKSEGVIETTLGLSPLYNVDSEGKGSLDEKFFSYIYNNMNHYYDFSGLHRAKEKYAPTHWKPRYYAYYPKPFVPQYAYAIVKAQMPEKLSAVIVDFIKQGLAKKGAKANKS